MMIVEEKAIDKQELFVIKLRGRNAFLHVTEDKQSLIFKSYILGAALMDEKNRRVIMQFLTSRYDDDFQSVRLKNLNFVHIPYEN